MASASFIASCCLGNKSIIINNEIPQAHILLEERVVSYMSLFFSAASLLGIAVWVLSWKPRIVGLSNSQTIIAQISGVNHASKCLIITAMLANIGLIIRSTIWLMKYYPQPMDTHFGDGKHLFCIISTMWVQYLFLSVIFWHLAYAFETYMASSGLICSHCVQYLIGWVVPAALCSIGAWLAYTPNLGHCGARKQINSSMMYLVFLLPLLICFILICILFYKATHELTRTLIRHFGTYSTREREIMDKVSSRFLIFVTSFAICWTPNIVTGMLINFMSNPSAEAAVLVFLVLESVLNPFHVFIDSMVMFGWPTSRCCEIFRSRYHDNSNYANINDLECSQRSTGSSEREPLLTFSRTRRH